MENAERPDYLLKGIAPVLKGKLSENLNTPGMFPNYYWMIAIFLATVIVFSILYYKLIYKKKDSDDE